MEKYTIAGLCNVLIPIGCLLASPAVHAVSFSVDFGTVGVPASDVNIDSIAINPQLQNNIYEGGVGATIGTNAKIINGGPAGGGKNGLQLAVPNNLNALSKGNDPTNISLFWDITFSVDAASVGKAGSAVNGQAAVNSAAGQIFWGSTMALGNNFTKPWADEQQHGLDDVLSPEDNLDAMDIWDGGTEPIAVKLNDGTSFYYSLDGTASIFKAPGGGGPGILQHTAAQAGLLGGDDIDAMIYNSLTDLAYFSLAPGSSTLVANNLSAADIFSTSFLGSFNLNYTANDLGLLFTDNIDALEISLMDPGVPSPVPVPAAFWLFGSGLLGLVGITRRKKV